MVLIATWWWRRREIENIALASWFMFYAAINIYHGMWKLVLTESYFPKSTFAKCLDNDIRANLLDWWLRTNTDTVRCWRGVGWNSRLGSLINAGWGCSHIGDSLIGVCTSTNIGDFQLIQIVSNCLIDIRMTTARRMRFCRWSAHGILSVQEKKFLDYLSYQPHTSTPNADPDQTKKKKKGPQHTLNQITSYSIISSSFFCRIHLSIIPTR